MELHENDIFSCPLFDGLPLLKCYTGTGKTDFSDVMTRDI